MLISFFEAFLILKYPLLCLFISFAFLSLFWAKIFHTLNFKTYENIQRVHNNEISRLGGLFIYIFFASLVWLEFIQQEVIVNILIAAIPFILISVKEDLFHNTSPLLRLITMVMSCLIFFYLNPIDFPLIDFPYLGNLISMYPVGIIFFTFSILVVMNGMNLIDGMNGLFGLTAILQLLSIASISFFFGDNEIVVLSSIFLAPLIIFLSFNFPFGKVFVGDTGAYFYGFVIALLTIYTFGKYNQLMSWLAVIILFYPCFELLFSYVRKSKNNLNPLNPDNRHLHSIIYRVLINKNFTPLQSNYLTTVTLIPLFSIPFIFILYFMSASLLNIIFTLFFIVLIYLVIYYKVVDKTLN